MAKNGQLKVKESDKPGIQTEAAFKFLVNEENIERTMAMVSVALSDDSAAAASKGAKSPLS